MTFVVLRSLLFNFCYTPTFCLAPWDISLPLICLPFQTQVTLFVDFHCVVVISVGVKL